MIKSDRQLFLLILFAVSAFMPQSLYSARKYCDAAIVGILQGNPKEVEIIESSVEDSDLSYSKDVYKFEADGSISLYAGLKPQGIVRDDLGRLTGFKLIDGDKEIRFNITWGDTNKFKVNQLEFTMSVSDLPGVYYKLIEKFEYGVKPGRRDERKDQYVTSMLTKLEVVDEEGNNIGNLIMDNYTRDNVFNDVSFDEKGNLEHAMLYVDIYNHECKDHRRVISYYPDDSAVELKITHDNYRKTLDEIDRFFKSPFGFQIDLSKTNSSSKKTISLIEKFIKTNGWNYSSPSQYLSSSPWVIKVNTPLSFLGNKCKVEYRSYLLDKDQKKYFDAGYSINITLQGPLYELMQFAANLEAMFTDYGLRKGFGLKNGRDTWVVSSMYDSKDYYYGYGHIVDEKVLYSESNKQMSRGNVTMNIPRDGSAIGNSILTIEIGFVIRKN